MLFFLFFFPKKKRDLLNRMQKGGNWYGFHFSQVVPSLFVLVDGL